MHLLNSYICSLLYVVTSEKSFQRRLVGNVLYYVNEFRGFIEVNNLKISTKGRYGLTIMIELAKQFGEGPVPLRKIASENELSEAYLEQLVSPLRNSGLVKSVRGAHGGYKLSKPPHLISAGDVIRVLEGPIQPVEGIENEAPPQRELWSRIRDAVKTVLDTTTIEDLAKYSESPSDDGYMYYI